MKKIFIGILCAMLSTSLVTGCGNKKEENKEENKEETKVEFDISENFIWPTIEEYTITSYFGNLIGLKNITNLGIVISLDDNSNVYASGNGIIIKKEYDEKLGNFLLIDHHNGYYTLYGQLLEYADGIDVDSIVTSGQVIGYTNSLYFQMNSCSDYESTNCAIDPLPFIK